MFGPSAEFVRSNTQYQGSTCPVIPVVAALVGVIGICIVIRYRSWIGEEDTRTASIEPVDDTCDPDTDILRFVEEYGLHNEGINPLDPSSPSTDKYDDDSSEGENFLTHPYL
jgi:hypothetical protein